MDETFDPITLLFLVLAVVIFLRLRSVLGKRTGHERQPYETTLSRQQETNQDNKNYQNDNVVPLPTGREPEQETQRVEKDNPAERIKGIADEGSHLETQLLNIAKKDLSFNPKEFIIGAKMAYEMIVIAFNEGNRSVLKPLLATDVYESFEGEITAREEREEVIDSSFVGIDKAIIIDADLKGSEALVTMKIASKIISAVRDKAGEVIAGDPKNIIEMTDIWTFSKIVTSQDPNWKLVGTEAAN